MPQPLKEAVGGFESMKIIQDLEKKYQVKLGFLIILVTIGELMMEDIEDYLQKKYGLSPEAAADINDILQADIFGPAIELVAKNPKILASNLSIAQQKENISNLFKKNLIKLISADKNTVDNINLSILNIIDQEMASDHLMFESDLAKMIAENQERLTNKPFQLSGKPAEPTIANWLKDFTDRRGNNYFNNLVLSEYITNSQNTASLSDEERKLLFKVSALYRNLKFFSAISEDVPMEGWDFIPVDESENSSAPTYPAGGDYNLENMTALEIKAFMEANNLTEEDLKK
ncbi:MAG: hypothetical protein AAB358_01040 [Patescibacteria group bacterium]